MKSPIHTKSAPQAIGPYSQAIKVDHVVYFSGQIPLNPLTMELISANFRQQATQVFDHLKAVATAAGGSLDKIVKLTIYLINFDDFPILNEVMKSFFSEPFPARTTIQVSALPKQASVEIDAIMIL